jgi:septum formation protein
MISSSKNARQNNIMAPRSLVLASTSRYRQALLGRLGIAFDVAAPDCDETPLAGEPPTAMALRLAEAKARAVAGAYPDALIVGSDQVAMLGAERLDKPGGHANAVRQLTRLSGKTATFHTAVALLDARHGVLQARLVPCRVSFRTLSERQIETYLRREQPYDCAGSAKSEALGIALIARMETEDPTALVGLPLIALTEMLEKAGLPVLG